MQLIFNIRLITNKKLIKFRSVDPNEIEIILIHNILLCFVFTVMIDKISANITSHIQIALNRGILSVL